MSVFYGRRKEQADRASSTYAYRERGMDPMTNITLPSGRFTPCNKRSDSLRTFSRSQTCLSLSKISSSLRREKRRMAHRDWIGSITCHHRTSQTVLFQYLTAARSVGVQAWTYLGGGVAREGEAGGVGVDLHGAAEGLLRLCGHGVRLIQDHDLVPTRREVHLQPSVQAAPREGHDRKRERALVGRHGVTPSSAPSSVRTS